MRTSSRFDLGLAVLAAAALAGCAVPPAEVTLDFRPDVSLGGEAYLCFGFALAGDLRARGIESIEWLPAPGGVALHHGKLYASSTAYPAGPVPCDQQPTGAVPLHVFTPGGAPLRLPPGVNVALPADTLSLVVEAHVLRSVEGEAPMQRVRLTMPEGSRPSTIRAGWTGRAGPVPALRPGHLETSIDRCALETGFHVYLAWGHEHLLGRSFRATVTAAPPEGAGVLTLVDVPRWDFAAQVGVAVDADLHPGELLETTCTWVNDTDHYVLPGPRTTDEMCGLGLIVSPPVGAQVPCTGG